MSAFTPDPTGSGGVAVLREAAQHAPRVLPAPLGETAARWLTAEADCHASAAEVVVSTLPSAVEFARQVLALLPPPGRVTCPWCGRDGRALDPEGRIRYHHGNAVYAPHRCAGTGRRPSEHEERAS